MTVDALSGQFYRDLAEWWPVISPVTDYAEEAAELQRLISTRHPHAQTLLELGSGGGHVAHYLRQHYRCCLSDLSESMLALSRTLNPDCEHVQGDMRSLRVGRCFDVVLVHDAIDYMTTESDLVALCHTAWMHLAHAGVVVFVPDAVAETYEPGSDVSGGDGDDGRSARLLEWSEPLAEGSSAVLVHYAFLLRSSCGRMQSHYEAHSCGVFPESTWLRRMREAGFVVDVVEERTHEERTPRRIFLGRKGAHPASSVVLPCPGE